MNETTKQTSPQNRYDVSCLVTFHSEGYLAHRTLTSIGMCRDYAEKRGLSVELVLVLDNADAVTEAVVAGHFAVRKDDQILRVSNRSLPLSRNDGVKAARGEFVSVHDGDDYYSENLVYEGVTFCRQKAYAIVHVGALIEFEANHCIYDLCKTEYTPYDFVKYHPLISESIASRDVYLSIPYQPTGNGFGYEDWHWNAETIAAGYVHIPLPRTFLFYRRKKQGSMLAHQSARKSLIRPSRLFDKLDYPVGIAALDCTVNNKIEPLLEQTLPSPVELVESVTPAVKKRLPLSALVKRPAKKMISWLPDDLQPPTKAFAQSFLTLARSVKGHLRNKLPQSVQVSPLPPQQEEEKTAPKTDAIQPASIVAACEDALKKMSSLDPLLHPAAHAPLYEYCPFFDDRLGKLFALLYNPLRGRRYDVVYIVPYIARGGADLMIVNFANALAGEGRKVMVISTLPCQSPWRSRLLERVDYLDFGNAAAEFSDEDRQLLLARLLLQLQPTAVHCMQSQLGFETFSDYADALRQYMKLYVSFYADALRADGSEVGYISQFLSVMLPVVDGVSTDNAVMPRRWHEKYGAPLALFRTVYGRMTLAARDGAAPLCSGDSVLWAGRFYSEKRPELLLEIVRKMPETHFFVYGAPGTKENERLYDIFKSLPNVTLGGRYDGFASLPLQDCFCFLYTSAYDGLPNVLLEAAAAGLPAVAPDIGGISDFIDGKTGWLLAGDPSSDDYVKTIREMRGAPQLCRSKALAAQSLLRQRHNETAFRNSVLTLYGFSAGPQTEERRL